jgi:hypothetical protein
MRRDLLTAARPCLDASGGERFTRLFEPPLPTDPDALRRYQKPGPPFALLPDPVSAGDHEPGDRIELNVTFWGLGTQLIGDFAEVLQALGRHGLHRGEGRFELAGITAEDAAGNRCRLWPAGRTLLRLAPPVNEIGWWLERSGCGSSVLLEFITPARLISAGRPLFRPAFRQLFPFILRRVTSVLYACCGSEAVGDPAPLLAAAAQVRETDNRLAWRDWRSLDGEDRSQELGGLVGSVRLEGAALEELCWVLSLGTLLNLGKGAAWGAGRYRLG